jgi:uncharacterized membrane protein YdjX (TVP38/TMEM64 family)
MTGVIGPLAEASAWLQDIGVSSGPIFGTLYVVASLLGFPSGILTLAGGFIYGPVVGTPIASLASTAAAVAGFLIARWLSGSTAFGERLRAGGSGRLPGLSAVGGGVRHHPFASIVLLRLSPVLPFTPLNYALGLTDVPLRTYALASWLGMLPGTVVYASAGAAVSNAAALIAFDAPTGPAGLTLVAAGLAATVGVVLLFSSAVRRPLCRDRSAGVPAPAERSAS